MKFEDITMSTKYYFEKFDKFPFPEIFEADSVLDMFAVAKKRLDEFKKSDIKGNVGSNVHIEGIVVIEEGAKILDGTYIVGPAFIGKNTKVGPNAYIRPYTLIGRNCSIGNREIKGSIVMDYAEANHHGYIGDSILGYKVHFGAGVTTANLRFDGKNVFGDKRKIGAIVGDNSQVGVNAATLPGTFIGQNVWVYPGLSVRGFLKSGSYVKSASKGFEVVERKGPAGI